MATHDPKAVMDLKFLELMKLLNVYLNHFPRFEDRGLSASIRQTALDLYGLIIEGQERYRKKTTLTLLVIRHEQLRAYVRLANELGYFEFWRGSKSHEKGKSLALRYLRISALIDELGRMIGGWLKKVVEVERGKGDV